MAEQLQDTVEIENTAQPTIPPQQTSAQPTQAPQQPVMGCPGDCNRCTPMHRSYCASQIAYNMQNAVARIENAVARLEGAAGLLAQSLAEINARIANIEAQLQEQKTKEAEQLDFFAPEPASIGTETPKKPSKK